MILFVLNIPENGGGCKSQRKINPNGKEKPSSAKKELLFTGKVTIIKKPMASIGWQRLEKRERIGGFSFRSYDTQRTNREGDTNE
ncbi:MAG: hypothetical protein KH138_10705, partial [Firmicutes bacterium]|nr:hypothetical protein [Bacillota bacterium]